jgi:hypothetical protein
MDRLLYFPLASPPSEVALQAALYWDSLYTVTPPEYSYRSPLLRALEDVGVLREIDLSSTLNDHDINQLTSEVDTVLAALPGEKLDPDGWLADTGASRLYRGKLPRAIENNLMELGAATEGRTDGHLRSSPYVTVAVLSVMCRHAADVLDGRDPSARTSLLADNRKLWQQAVGPLPDAPVRPGWKVQIGGALPIPSPDTPPQDVITFRERYRSEREELSVALAQLASSLSDGDEVSVRSLSKLIEASQASIEAAARSRRISLVKSGLAVVVSTTGAAVGATIGGEAGAAILTLGSAVMNISLVPTRHAHKNGLSYISTVRQEFGLS